MSCQRLYGLKVTKYRLNASFFLLLMRNHPSPKSFANILFYFELYKCFNPKNTTNLQPYKNATVLQNHTHSNFQHFYNFTILQFIFLFLLFLTQGRKIKFG